MSTLTVGARLSVDVAQPRENAALESDALLLRMTSDSLSETNQAEKDCGQL